MNTFKCFINDIALGNSYNIPDFKCILSSTFNILLQTIALDTLFYDATQWNQH